MITRFHYDRETLARFLDEAGPESDSDIAVHLEQCNQCQATLESLLSEGLTMEAAGDLLRGEAAEQLACDQPHTQQPTELAHSTFLEPSEHPESLGRFARFEIMEFLGRGGMGIVMRGYDTSLNRHSAVKVLAPELATSAAARKRFSREAKSAAAVVHPHVVPIQTVDEHNGLPYLVMPVVEGQSVDARVRNSGPLSVMEAIRIASQIADGLAAAHAQGLVHRDIKPANVLLENGVERVQITDFGLARAIDDASMTRSGIIAGTPQYMSPEQAHGDSIDHRSDLFSLGSLIYFMLTGHSPFRAETTMGVLNRICNEQPRSLRSINADIPDWLEQIVMKLLAKPREDRFQTAAEVAELMQRWHAHLQQPDIVDPPQKTDRKLASVAHADRSQGGLAKWLIATAAAGFLAFAGVFIVLELDKGTLTIESEADDVPIQIMQGDEVVKQLTVTRTGTSVRVASGKYVVLIDGEFSDLHVESEAVTLGRRETKAVRIVQASHTSEAGQSARQMARTYYDHLYHGREVDAKSLLASEARPHCSQHKWFNEVRNLVSVAKPHDPKVATRGDTGIAVFDAMPIQSAHADIGDVGCLCLKLIREGDEWRIDDVDLWKPNDAKQSLQHLVQSNEALEKTTQMDKLRAHEATTETGSSKRFNTPTVLAALHGRWRELNQEEGEAFNQTLIFTGGASGQWYKTAMTLPVSITYYVEGPELILQYNYEPETSFDYRMKQLRFDYELDGDALVLTREGVTTRFERIRNSIGETPLAQASAPTQLYPAYASSPQGAGVALPTPVRTLADHVQWFNRRTHAVEGDDAQPPLTIDELLCFAQWKLETDDPSSVEKRSLLTAVGIGRWLPAEWSIEGGESSMETTDGAIRVYRIQLANRISGTKIVVRERYLSPPAEYLVSATVAPEVTATPLSEAITEFNALHNQIDGKRQPPLTLEEVLAAIADGWTRRSGTSVDNETDVTFQEIAKTHRLPADAKFEVLPTFQTAAGDTFKIWSIRIVLPHATTPMSTTAFTIREQYLSVNSALDTMIHWGQPNDDGLQAGFRLIPGQRAYQVGQSIETEFFYRSISGKAIPASLPNIFSHRKLIARDAQGNDLDIVEVRDKTVGGAMETQIGETPTRKHGKPLELGYITPDPQYDSLSPHYTYLTVEDGQRVFLEYVVSDFNGGELHTAELVVDLAATSSTVPH
ncbi:serine/threonine-protein kinase [Aureliella helgolandensis]|uniref:non-specific serine/threonine protein kinase n=1 Tax=Aureliella helgolandensis TaxID=2527968 RepID=A0A518G1P0_9BACT|nr:serine/threonine-protein kinase [Aureliella helgolandensis]QDV22521.1 Serine/threonine-protein kinase PknB [Aureliella helgolandensis]